MCKFCALRFQLPDNTKDAQDAQKTGQSNQTSLQGPGSRVSILFMHYYIFIAINLQVKSSCFSKAPAESRNCTIHNLLLLLLLLLLNTS